MSRDTDPTAARDEAVQKHVEIFPPKQISLLSSLPGWAPDLKSTSIPCLLFREDPGKSGKHYA